MQGYHYTHHRYMPLRGFPCTAVRRSSPPKVAQQAAQAERRTSILGLWGEGQGLAEELARGGVLSPGEVCSEGVEPRVLVGAVLEPSLVELGELGEGGG